MEYAKEIETKLQSPVNDDTRSLVIFLCATILRYFRGSKPNVFDNVQNITIDIQKLLTWFKSFEPDMVEGIFLHPEAAVGYHDFWKTVTTIEHKTLLSNFEQDD